MTQKEKRYLQEQVERNKRIMEQVEKGELWGNIYETEELRLAFIQGMNYVNEMLDAFVNTK